MKQFFQLGFSLALFFSCSADDSPGSKSQELAPVVSVNLPDSLIHARTNEIDINYTPRTSCHRFSGFDISKNTNVFVFGVVTSLWTGSTNCVETGILQDSVILKFVAEREDFYIFKFWQGKDTEGKDEFLTIEVPIAQPDIE